MKTLTLISAGISSLQNWFLSDTENSSKTGLLRAREDLKTVLIAEVREKAGEINKQLQEDNKDTATERVKQLINDPEDSDEPILSKHYIELLINSKRFETEATQTKINRQDLSIDSEFELTITQGSEASVRGPLETHWNAKVTPELKKLKPLITEVTEANFKKAEAESGQILNAVQKLLEVLQPPLGPDYFVASEGNSVWSQDLQSKAAHYQELLGNDTASPPDSQIGPFAPEPWINDLETEVRQLLVVEKQPGLNLGEIAEDLAHILFSKAFDRFTQEYLNNFKEKQETEDYWKTIKTRLKTADDRNPLYAETVLESVMNSKIMRQRVLGSVRMVLRYDGHAILRRPMEEESAVMTPFTNWLDDDAATGLPVLVPPAAPEECCYNTAVYMDWIAPPHGANAPVKRVGMKIENICRTEIFLSSETGSFMKKLMNFAAQLRGLKPLTEGGNDLGGRGKLDALSLNEMADISRDPGPMMIRNWLGNFRDADCRIAVTIEPAGLMIIVISMPKITAGSQDRSTYRNRAVLDNIALVMASVVKRAMDPSATYAGDPQEARSFQKQLKPGRVPDKGTECFTLLPTTIRPLRLKEDSWKGSISEAEDKTHVLNHNQCSQLGLNILKPSALAKLETDGTGTHPSANAAVLQLAARYGQALDKNLPHLSENTSSQTGDETTADSTDLYNQMYKTFNLTSWWLGLVMIFALFLPTLLRKIPLPDTAELAGQTDILASFPSLNQTEIGMIALAFLMATIWRFMGVYGLDNIIRNETSRLKSHQSGNNTVGRFIDFVTLQMFRPKEHGISHTIAMWMFKGRYTLRYDVILLSLICVILLVFQMPEFAETKSTSDQRFLVGFASKVIWATPALALGFLLQSSTMFKTTISEVSGKRIELLVLRDLQNLLKAGSALGDQLKRIIKGQSSRSLPYFGQIYQMIPPMDGAAVAIERSKARVEGEINKANAKFLRRSGYTIALLTLFAGFGPLKSIKPDDVHIQSKPLETFLAGWQKPMVEDCSSYDLSALETAYKDGKFEEEPFASDIPNNKQNLLNGIITRCLAEQQKQQLATLGNQIAGQSVMLTLQVAPEAEISNRSALARTIREQLTYPDGYLRLPGQIDVQRVAIGQEYISIEPSYETTLAQGMTGLLSGMTPVDIPSQLALGQREDVFASLQSQVDGELTSEIDIAKSTTSDTDFSAIIALASPPADGQTDPLVAENHVVNVPAALQLNPWEDVRGTLSNDIAEQQAIWAKANDPLKVAVGLRPADGAVEAFKKELKALISSGIDVPVNLRSNLMSRIPENCSRPPLASFFFDYNETAAPSFACSSEDCSQTKNRPSNVARAPGSFDPTPILEDIESRLAGGDYLNWNTKSSQTDDQLLLVGYADSTGSLATNMVKSRQRAETVDNLLRAGLNTDNIAAIWRGEEQLAFASPVTPKSGNDWSRRVDLHYCRAAKAPDE